MPKPKLIKLYCAYVIDCDVCGKKYAEWSIKCKEGNIKQEVRSIYEQMIFKAANETHDKHPARVYKLGYSRKAKSIRRRAKDLVFEEREP